MKVGRRTLIAAAGAAAALPLMPAEAKGLRWQIVGAWTLRGAWTIDAQTGVRSDWYQRTPPLTGLIVYTSSGEMSVQIVSQRAPFAPDAELMTLDPAGKAAVLDSYYAYFGRFEVDEAAGLIRHHVIASLDPSETGAVLTRRATLEQGVLALETERDRDGASYNRLEWVRP